MANDVMMGFTGSLAPNFLAEEDIRKKCPLAFATLPTNKAVSDKYVVANTATVIDDMAKLGWQVVEAKQRKAKKRKDGEGPSRFSFHMIALQNPDIKITKQIADGEEIVDCYPQIILTNSHDGLNCFKIMVGLFRCVCSNGLVIATDKMVDLSIRHIHYSFDELRRSVNQAIEQVSLKVERMTLASSIELDEDQKLLFAKEAISIRKGIEINEVEVDQETLEDILTPLRKEDEGNSLWNVFNVLQEKIIKGGYFEAKEGGKVRKVRKVTSFVKDLDINRRLWQAMEEFIPAEDVDEQ